MPDTPVFTPLPHAYQAAPLEHWLCRILALLLFAGVAYYGLHGHWLAAGLIAWFSSHGLMVIFRCLMGPHSLAEVFDPHTQSWAMLADFGLAVGIAAASYGTRYLSREGWYFQLKWVLPVAALAYILGVAVGYVWHNLLDRPNYVEAGGEALLNDPWKLIHDETSYTVLAASLVLFVAVTVFNAAMWSHHWWVPLVLIMSMVIWGAGGAHDSKGLDIFKLHDAYNRTTNQYDPSYRMERL